MEERVKIVCESCKGTGISIPLYKTEHVLRCGICEGKGYKIKAVFLKLQKVKCIKRVHLSWCECGGATKDKKGGISYNQFFKSKGTMIPGPSTQTYCPQTWHHFTQPWNDITWLEKIHCNKFLPTRANYYTDCNIYENKKTCWQLYLKNNSMDKNSKS